MIPVRSQWGRYNLPRYTIHAPQKLCSTIASTIYSNYGKKNIVLNSNLQVIEATHGKKNMGILQEQSFNCTIFEAPR